MNQSRIWCVVHPHIGLPLFLGSVAVTSFIVHASVMSHTDWMSNYWEGGAKRVALNTVPAAPSKADTAFTVSIAPVAATSTAPASFVVTVTPNVAVSHTASVSASAPVRTASTN